MSASQLSVRLSDVRYTEQDLDRQMERNSHSVLSDGGNESPVSVRDARRLFESLSVSNLEPSAIVRESATLTPLERTPAAGPISTPDTKRKKPETPPKKPVASPRLSSSPFATGKRSCDSNQKGQRSPGKSIDDVNSVVSIISASQEVNNSSSGPKAKSKAKSLKQVLKRSITTGPGEKADSSSGEPSGAVGGTAAFENKLSSATWKLFKGRNMEKNKKGTTAEHNSSNGSSGTNKNAKEDSKCEKGDESLSPSSAKKNSSPNVRKGDFETPSPSKSPPSTPSSTQSSPSYTTKHSHRVPFRRSFSARVLTRTNQDNAVLGTLKRGGKERSSERGLAEAESGPISPRVIEDKELKLNMSKDLGSLSGAELKSILSKQYAYISGGLDGDCHLILTFPDVGLRQLDSPESFRQLITTIIYLKSLVSVQHLNAGFTVLLDAHSSKTHTSCRQLLEKLANKEFPVTIHMVYIFMKVGLFNRSKSLATNDISNKLHVACFCDTKSLVEQLGAENLTPELGGTMNYTHAAWVFNRLEFEKMLVLHRHAIASMPEVSKSLNMFSVPETIKEAEQLLQRDMMLKENLVNRITEAELNIDGLLTALVNQGSEAEIEGGASSAGAKDYGTMKDTLEAMTVDLHACIGEFDTFWLVHKARVDHMMHMCHFRSMAISLESSVKQYMDELTTGGVHLGDTLESSLELGEKHEMFVTKMKSVLESDVNKLREDAEILCNPQFGSKDNDDGEHTATKVAVSVVHTTLNEMNVSYKDLTTMCQQKRDLFIVCVKLHMTTRQCTQWIQDVLEFLASQPMESPSYKQANLLIAKIDDFLYQFQPLQVQSLQELASALPEERTFQKSVQKTILKYEHSCELLNKRKADLLKVLNAGATAAYSSGKTKGKKHKEKEKPDIEILNSTEPTDGSMRSINAIQSMANPEASLFLSKTMADGGASEYVDEEVSESTIKSRGFVYRELMATEKDYIRDLNTIIDSYYDAMDESETIPLRLRGKRHVIFGNLSEIYKFHDVVFVKALEQFAEHPERMGEIFIQFAGEFQMYSVYCKNRSNSEALLSEQPENEAFFKGIQINLDHQLPLNSYLLKPVQRVTKYQLLLKDMMKHAVNAPKAHSNLQKALDQMLKVLKNLNDSLHVVGLKGFPGALAEQGRLLVHDAFQVWEGHGNPGRSLFSRAKERHVFLFERVLIVSKKFEAPTQKKAKKSDNYLYKMHMSLADIALREVIEGQPLQFSLAVHGQHKDFSFQAQTKDIHTMWTCELRRLLQVQFMLMKDMVIQSGTLDRRTYKGKARQNKDSRLFADSFKIRPGASPSSKKASSRFNILKRRRNGALNPKVKKGLDSLNPESSLMVSGSVPASIRYGLRDVGCSVLSLSQASIDSSQRKMSDSMSSDDEDDDFYYEEEEGDIDSAVVDQFDSLAPGAPRYYTAISAYSPGGSDDNGITLSMEQEIEVIGINQYGWWWVRATNPSNGEVEEGWVPSSYLKVSRPTDAKL